RDSWDEETASYSLHITQHTPPTPGQDSKEALVIPLAMGLLGDAGNLRIQLEGEASNPESADNTQHVLLIRAEEQSFTFTGLPERPIPSLLRGFSAPVRVDYPYSREDLLALASRDDDGFVRWDAMQQLMVGALTELQALETGENAGSSAMAGLDPILFEAAAALIDNPVDAAVTADMLRLPSESTLAELAAHKGGVDPIAIHRAREALRRQLANAFDDRWLALFADQRVTEDYAATGLSIRAAAASKSMGSRPAVAL
ncbi:MAG: DUF3458 domain-containing protein, partial [Pseudomonadota bacterium]